ncbi:delta-type opioid receptor-like [Actinia tenebrosa]|uniref:Delta-type opioid receptor-like n=1 Tax=Actinia tenebrosa TaxID=6105 RepID=A0A6P8HLG7_ACTTE|nr:delta-type opioid receptor-like [Actinia tenebrosa]
MATVNFSNCSWNATRSGNCSLLYPNLDNWPFPQSLASRVGKMCAYIIVAVLALLGNGFVIVIISRNKHLRKAINYFILNMAISDLVTPLIIIPIQLYPLTVEHKKGVQLVWPFDGDFGSFLCKLSMFLADSSPVVSIMSLVFMTVDRFYAVVFPLKAQRVSHKIRLTFLTISWIVGFGFFSPHFQVVHVVKIEDHFYCQLSFAPTFNHTKSMHIFFTTACVLFTIIPFILLTVMYSVMLLSLKKETIAHTRNVSSRRQKNNRKIVFMALVIVLVFAVCWGPYNGFIFVITIVWRWKLPRNLADKDLTTFSFVTHFLTCTNAALNPCIYFIFIQSYRSALKNLFCKEPKDSPKSILSLNDSNQWQGKVTKRLLTTASNTRPISGLKKNSIAGSEMGSFV